MPGDINFIWLWCNIPHRLLVQGYFICIECPWMYAREMWLLVPDNCVPVIGELRKCCLRCPCLFISFGRVWVVVYGYLYGGSFYSDKCCLMGWCPVKFCIMNTKICNEFMIVAHKTKKIGVFVGCMTPIASVFDGRDFISVVLRICPKYWIFCKEMSFAQFLGQLEFVKDLLEMVQMIFCHLTVTVTIWLEQFINILCEYCLYATWV